jgi:hypothetical protein
MTGAMDDFLDRHARAGGTLDYGIVGLATQEPFYRSLWAQVSRSGSTVLVDKAWRNGAEALPDRLQKGGAGVFHEMPAICNLDRLRARPFHRMPITCASVTRDNGNAGMANQPRLNGCLLAIGQQIDDTVALEMTDNGAVALPTLPGEIVDADHAGR